MMNLLRDEGRSFFLFLFFCYVFFFGLFVFLFSADGRVGHNPHRAEMRTPCVDRKTSSESGQPIIRFSLQFAQRLNGD